MGLPVKGSGKSRAPAMARNPEADDEDDLDDLTVRPPPPPAAGKYRARVSRLQVFEKAGTKTRAIIFSIDDDKERDALNKGKPSQQGKEIILRLQFDGNFYQQTMRHLSNLGFPHDQWKQAPNNGGGILPWAKMKETLTPAEKTKAPFFTIEIESKEGKGERAGEVFENIKKIEPFKTKAAPKKKPSDEPEPSNADEAQSDESDSDNARENAHHEAGDPGKDDDIPF